MRDAPCDRAGGDNGGRSKVNLRVGLAHAPFEIAIGSGDDDFARGGDAQVIAHARPAAGHADHRARVEQGRQDAALQCLAIDLIGRRDDQQACSGVDAVAAQDLGRGGQVFDAAIRAGPDKGHVHSLACHFRKRAHIVHVGRARDERLDLVKVQCVLCLIVRIGVGVKRKVFEISDSDC